MSERELNPREHAAATSRAPSTWIKSLPEWLIRHAARRAPPDLSERLEEEWRADLADRKSIFARLRFAFGCCWATGVIVWEHRPESLPVTSAAVRPKAAIGYMRDDSRILARRSLTFFLVAGLHVLLFYVLMTGLAFKIIKVMPTAFQVRLLQPPRERAIPPSPPPQASMPKLYVPIPDFPAIDVPVEKGEIIPEPPPMLSSPPEAPPLQPHHEVLRTAGGPGIGFPNTDDYYPSISKRLEEQGLATVHVCVGVNGRLTSDPTIAESSGNRRLDEGALMLAKAGSGHYRATTEDGRPVDSCYSFRVRFALRAGG